MYYASILVLDSDIGVTLWCVWFGLVSGNFYGDILVVSGVFL